MAKLRLDVALTQRGLTDSRQKAQALIMAGEVYVNGQKETKAGAPVKEEDALEVRGKALPYVSRGGLKLEKAMQVWPIDLKGGGVRRHRGLHRGLYRLHAPERGSISLRGGRGL